MGSKKLKAVVISADKSIEIPKEKRREREYKSVYDEIHDVVVETACVGEGSSYCEFKAVPGELDELSAYLTAMDSAKIERIEHRLMEQVNPDFCDN